MNRKKFDMEWIAIVAVYVVLPIGLGLTLSYFAAKRLDAYCPRMSVAQCVGKASAQIKGDFEKGAKDENQHTGH